MTIAKRIWILPALLACCLSTVASAQQMIERGPFGKPVKVLDETQRWSIPILVYEDKDIELYIPDVTTSEWIQSHAGTFNEKGQYTLSLFAFYKTERVCRKNQIDSGLGDQNHLDACASIGYKSHLITVNTWQKNITVLSSAWVDKAGQVYPELPPQKPGTRPFNDLDQNLRDALKKTTEIVAKEIEALNP